MYYCKPGIAIFACRVTWNNAYSPFKHTVVSPTYTALNYRLLQITATVPFKDGAALRILYRCKYRQNQNWGQMSLFLCVCAPSKIQIKQIQIQFSIKKVSDFWFHLTIMKLFSKIMRFCAALTRMKITLDKKFKTACFFSAPVRFHSNLSSFLKILI